VFGKLEDFIILKTESGSFTETRKRQAEKRFDYWVQNYILQMMSQENHTGNLYESHKKNASELRANPSTEAKLFVDQLLKK